MTQKDKDKMDLKENLSVLFEGEELTDTFKKNATDLFEAAVQERVLTLTEEIEEKVSKELVESIDNYSSYVVESWVKDNMVALEEASKVQFAEKIISKFREILEEVGVEVPSEKIDAHEALKKDFDALKTKLNESVEEVIQLKDTVSALKCERIIDTVAEDLSMSQKEHFVSLIENIEFNESTYESQIQNIKVKFFTEAKQAAKPEEELNEAEVKKEAKKYVNPYAGRLV